MFLLLAEPGIPTWLIQAFLVFLFVVLPIVRGVRESLAKKRELEQRRLDRVDPGQAPDAPDAMDEARRRWEALLRGEEVSAPPARSAPPAPPPIPIPRPTAATAAPASTSSPFGGPLSDLAPAPSEDATEAADDEATADPEHWIPDEETLARDANANRLKVERGERSDFLRREREGGAGRRANVAPDVLTSLGGAAAVTDAPVRWRPDIPFAELGDPRARRAALRRAVLMAEVLGTPAGLTPTGTSAAGPLALRPTS